MKTVAVDQEEARKVKSQSNLPYILLVALSVVALIACIILYRDKIKQCIQNITDHFKKKQSQISKRAQACEIPE